MQIVCKSSCDSAYTTCARQPTFLPSILTRSSLQTQKDIPVPFFASTKPIHATIVIGSFGSAQGLIADAFDIEIKLEANTQPPSVSAPVRYGKQPQIHHIFNKPAVYPSKVFPVFFVGAVLVTLPVVFYFVSSLRFGHAEEMRFVVLRLSNQMCYSGLSSSAQTSPTSPRLLVRRPSPTRSSSARSSAWSSFTSCTTAACPWATFFFPWLFLASAWSSAGSAPLVRYRAAVWQESGKLPRKADRVEATLFPRVRNDLEAIDRRPHDSSPPMFHPFGQPLCDYTDRRSSVVLRVC